MALTISLLHVPEGRSPALQSPGQAERVQEVLMVESKKRCLAECYRRRPIPVRF